MEQTKEKSISVTLNHLSALQPAEIAGDERVKTMFVKNFNAIHRSSNGEQVYELEKFYFANAVSQSPELKKCTKLSLYATFIEMAVMGLSFNPKSKLCYLVPQNVNVGTKETPVWETRAALEVSPYGELAIRQDYGQIKSADNPEVVYENEVFEVIQTPTGKQVNHKFSFPRKGAVIAVYIRVVKSDGVNDYFILDAAGMERLKAYSAKKNKGYANALYGKDGAGPDLGFWMAKCIKHAFKSYPKVKLKGQFTQLATDKIEDDDDAPIDYGMPLSGAEKFTEHEEVKQTVDEDTGEVTYEPTVIADAPKATQELDI